MSLINWFKFVLLGIVWGSSFLWIKIAVTEVGPFTLVSWRAFLALLGTVVVVVWRRSIFPIRKKAGVFLFLGIINMAVPFVLISWAEKFIPSGLASVLNSTVPLFTLVIAAVFLPDERMTARRGAGLLLGFGGVVVLMSNQLGEGFGDYQTGILAMLVGALCYGAGAVFARKKAYGLSPEAQSLGQLLIAFAVILPGAVGFEGSMLVPQLAITWLALLWLGLLGSCLALLLYFDLIQQVGATRASMTTYIFPLVGVLLGAVFLGEHPDWRLLAGAVMIIAGVWAVNRK